MKSGLDLAARLWALRIQRWQAQLHNPRYTAPPTLPEPRKGKIVVSGAEFPELETI